MPPRKQKTAGTKRKSTGSTGRKSKSPPPAGRRNASSATSSSTSSSRSKPAPTALPSAGLLLTCDPPTKQYIKRLDDLKSKDKKFVIDDLDATHLLIKEKARDEILRKVEDWMNEVRDCDKAIKVLITTRTEAISLVLYVTYLGVRNILLK